MDKTYNINKKQVRNLAIPAIIAAVAEPLISLVDSSFIADYHPQPTLAQAAVGLGSSFFLSVIWIFSQTRTAMSTIVSQFFGEKKLSDIATLIPQMIAINFLLGLFFSVVTWLFCKPVFIFYNANDAVLNQVLEYFSIRLIGFPFVLSTILVMGTFRGIQNTFWPMVISLCGVFINIFLDYSFLAGLFTEPMGVNGIAIASLMAQIIMFILAIILLLTKTDIAFKISFTLNPHSKSLFAMTGNLIVRSIAVNTAYYVSNRIAASNGEDYLAVQSVLINIWFLSAFVLEGWCNAGNALAGKFTGEKNIAALYGLTKYMERSTLILSVLLILFYISAYYFLGKLFFADVHTQTIFYSVFWLIALLQPINALAFVYDEILKGTGKMKHIRNVLLIATFAGFVPTAWVLNNLGLHLYAVWTAFIVWMILRAIGLANYFYKNYTV